MSLAVEARSELHATSACVAQVSVSCTNGEVVVGLEVSWAASPVAPYTNLATAIRVYCMVPSCDIITPSPPALLSPPPPPPLPLLSPPPPIPASPKPPPSGRWSMWFGSLLGPLSASGACPCGTYIRVRYHRACDCAV